MPRFTLFHVFYSSTFTLLFLILAVLLLIPPGDAIAQAFRRTHQLYNVFVVAGTYLLTAILALIIYISRVVAFRRYLTEIPKSHVPIRRQDLPRRLHVAVRENLDKSARITIESRPCEKEGAWGYINHPGWARPAGSDLMGVQYAAVVSELPGMLETKAKAMVDGEGQEIFLAARRDESSLRSYLDGLVIIGIAQQADVERFVELYERVRFRRRGKGIEESEFRSLMKAFAQLLRGMGADHNPHPPESLEKDNAEPTREGTDGAGSTGYVYEESGYARDEPEYSSTDDLDGSLMDNGRLGYGRLVGAGYDTTTSAGDYDDNMYGYTPERVDSEASSAFVGGASGTGTTGSGFDGGAGPGVFGTGRRNSGLVLVTPPRRRRPNPSSSGEEESIELGEVGRRQLSLRASSGTFG